MLILNLNGSKDVIFATESGLGFGRFNSKNDYVIDDTENNTVMDEIHSHILAGSFRLSKGV